MSDDFIERTANIAISKFINKMHIFAIWIRAAVKTPGSRSHFVSVLPISASNRYTIVVLGLEGLMCNQEHPVFLFSGL